MMNETEKKPYACDLHEEGHSCGVDCLLSRSEELWQRSAELCALSTMLKTEVPTCCERAKGL
jgi:hypothetical protein